MENKTLSHVTLLNKTIPPISFRQFNKHFHIISYFITKKRALHCSVSQIRYYFILFHLMFSGNKLVEQVHPTYMQDGEMMKNKFTPQLPGVKVVMLRFLHLMFSGNKLVEQVQPTYLLIFFH